MEPIRVFINCPTIFQKKAKYVFECFLRVFGVPYLICTPHDALLEAFEPHVIYGEIQNNDTLFNGLYFPISQQALNYFSKRIPYEQLIQEVDVAGVLCPILFKAVNFDNNNDCLQINEDLIASAFFFLSRWEEHTIKERDMYDRFPYKASIFAKQSKLSLVNPPVNQYLEAFRRLLNLVRERQGGKPLDYVTWRNNKTFAIALTHDVDTIYKWTIRGLVSSIYKLIQAALNGQGNEVKYHVKALVKMPCCKLHRKDPHWTFPKILKQEDRFGFNSSFYVKLAHTHPLDGKSPSIYRRALPKVLDILEKGEREIGVHGSTLSSEMTDQLQREKDSLEQCIQKEVMGLRFHNLRFEYHRTFLHVERVGFSYDTTSGFAEIGGFRSGFSFPYRPYNIADDRPFHFIEIPLVIMDGTFFDKKYLGLPVEEAYERIITILKYIKEWHGVGAILWHNSMYDYHLSRGYSKLYEDTMHWIKENNGWGASAEEIVNYWKRNRGGLSNGQD